MKREATHGGPRAVGRRSKVNSSRNGAERVTCFVVPSDAIDVSHVCAELGITRGELLMLGVNAARGTRGAARECAVCEGARRVFDEETGIEEQCTACAKRRGK